MGKRERGWGECFFFFSSLLFETPSPPPAGHAPFVRVSASTTAFSLRL